MPSRPPPFTTTTPSAQSQTLRNQQLNLLLQNIYHFFLHERVTVKSAHHGERRDCGCELASPFAERSVIYTVRRSTAGFETTDKGFSQFILNFDTDYFDLFRLSLPFQVDVVHEHRAIRCRHEPRTSTKTTTIHLREKHQTLLQ